MLVIGSNFLASEIALFYFADEGGSIFENMSTRTDTRTHGNVSESVAGMAVF